MALKTGDTAPDFAAERAERRIRFDDTVGDSRSALFSHTKDFTPACTTELGCLAQIEPELERRDPKIIGLSVDPGSDRERWVTDIEETQATSNRPFIADAEGAVSRLYGVLPAAMSGEAKWRTAADNRTVGNVWMIGWDEKITLILADQMTTGRNFDDGLRVVDCLQLSDSKFSTPVNSQPGEDVIVAGPVSDVEAKEISGGPEAPRPYVRIVRHPREEASGGMMSELERGIGGAR